MTSRKLISAAMASILGLSSLSGFAQPNDKRGHVVVVPQSSYQQERRDDRQGRREDRRDDRMDRREDRRDDRMDRREARRDAREDWRRGHRPHYYYNARGPEFHRGGYIPHDLRNHQYIVVDYRAHHLTPPPRGHQWVQVGADYVLIALATGLIAHIILSH